MANSDNEIIKGLYNLSNVQDRLRKYAQDKEYFKFWALRQVNTISILKVISEKFGVVPTEQISDWKFRYPEFDELDYSFYLQSNSGTGFTTDLIVANSYGRILSSNIRLLVNGMYTKKNVSSGSDVSATRSISSGIVYPEELRILSIGSDDSGGTGYRKVKVQRAHPASTASGTFPAITTSMKLVINNIVARADSYPLPPVTKNSKYLENNVQISRFSYGLSEHMTQGGGIDTFLANGTSAYLNIQYQLAETFLMKTIERAILTARGSEKVVEGSYEYETKGIDSFIQADTDHYLDFDNKTVTVYRINDFIRRMADVSGVKELWWFTGTELSEQIANAYENKSIYYTNGDLSLEYRMKVKTLESVGRDLIVNHVTAPILNEIGMANEGYALNLTEYNYNEKSKFGCFQIAHKVPFADEPKNADSYKADDGYKGKWRELYGAWGLVRRLSETHFKTINAPSSL